jgi:hypothetical protein
MLDEHRHLPDANRLSVLVAAILLAFALAQIVETQRYSLSFNIWGVGFSLPLNLTMAATLLAAGLTAAGMDWLLRGHPRFEFEQENTFQHWLLPALTAFAIGLPLYNLGPGSGWWLSFALGGVLLLLVFISEYIILDPSDVRYPAASAGLIALSFALFLILVVSLRYASARLVFIILVVFLASALVSLRALHLRLAGRWEFAWAGGIGLICAQFATSLHYWPLGPIQYGLALLGPLYALTGLAINLGDEMPARRAGIEAVLVLALFWAGALVVRI